MIYPDLPVFNYVGLTATVADAASDIRHAAMVVLERQGGKGAVRELLERILRSQGRWEELPPALYRKGSLTESPYLPS